MGVDRSQDFFSTHISELSVTSICSIASTRSDSLNRAPRYVPRSRFSNASRSNVSCSRIGRRSTTLKLVGVLGEHRVDAISFDAFSLNDGSQLNQIVRRWQHDDQHAIRSEHTRAFSRIPAPVDGKHDVDAVVLKRQTTIRVGNDPCQ